MAKSAQGMSVAQIERILNNRKSQLSELASKHNHLMKQLDRDERQLAALEDVRSGRRHVRSRLRIKRPRNEHSLRTVVAQVLSKHKKGLPLDPLSKKVLETGYKTHSANFKNVLYQCLYHREEFEHEPETGNYRLAN